MLNGNGSGHSGKADERLGRLLAMAAGLGPAGGPCPAPEQVAALMDGGLGGAERDAVLGHIAGCDNCRRVLETAVGLSSAGGVAETRRRWRFGMLVPYAAAAALVIAAVAGALLYKGSFGQSGTLVAKRYESVPEQMEGQTKSYSENDNARLQTGGEGRKSPPEPVPFSDAVRRLDRPAGGASGNEVYAGREKDGPSPGTIAPEDKPMGMRAPSPTPPSTAPAELAAPAESGPQAFSKAERAMIEERSGTPAPPAGAECNPSAEGGTAICLLPDDMAAADATKEEPARRRASAEALTKAQTGPAEQPAAVKPEVVKTKGTIVSLDHLRGEMVFLPAGDKENIRVNAADSLMRGLQAGDRVLMEYEKGSVNTATRIKKERKITVGVGC